MRDDILNIFSVKLRNVLSRLELEFCKLQEIRLRIDSPLIVCYNNLEYFISTSSKLTKEAKEAFIINRAELKETMEYISNYSLYAFEEELKQGFLTVTGGHRVGIAGKVILEEGKIKSIKHISFINVRLAHQKKGCADKVMPYLLSEKEVGHTLIISPPGCGKTTLLRDIIRQLSDGCTINGKYIEGKQVGVVDERSEIAACYMGKPQNDLGIRTDVLDCCPKAEGMMMMIRSMSPEVIAVDEIGLSEDISAVQYAIGCGCKLIATVHGGTMEEIIKKPLLGEFVKKHIFQRYIILSSREYAGRVEEIYDDRGGRIYWDCILETVTNLPSVIENGDS